MQMVKIIGSGPCHDQVTYGVEKHIPLFFKKGVCIEFSDPVLVGEMVVKTCNFSIENGAAMVDEESETDLLMVDTQDLPLLQNMYYRWMGDKG